MKYGRPYAIVLPNQKEMKGFCWPIPQPIANIVIVTGMAEGSYRYDDFAHFLNENQYSVYCIDHYGQGMNTEKPEDMGVWPKNGFREAVEMVHAEVLEVRKLGKPVYLLGHSMGSFVTQEFIQLYGDLIDQVVICGSCGKRFATHAGGFVADITCLFHPRDTHKAKAMHSLTFGTYNKKIKNPRTSSDWLSHNEESIDAYLADFRCNYIPTGGFYKEFMKGLNRIHKRTAVQKVRKDLPILLIAGEADPVGLYGKGVRRLHQMYQKAGIQNLQIHLYPDFRHEILNEIGKEKVYDDVVRFFQK